VDVLRQGVVVKALGCIDGLLKHLHGRIGEGGLIEAKRVGPGGRRARLIFLQEVLDARKFHFRVGNIEMVIDDAIELFGKLRHERRILHPDHAAAEQLRLQAELTQLFGGLAALHHAVDRFGEIFRRSHARRP